MLQLCMTKHGALSLCKILIRNKQMLQYNLCILIDFLHFFDHKKMIFVEY